MASVAKHPKSRFWTACYTDRTGRQLKRSTKTTDRNEALRIAIALEDVERQARKSALTTTQLRKVLSDVSEQVTGDSLNVPTVEQYLNDWLAGVETRIASTTHTRYESTVKSFLGMLGAKAQQPVTSVTPKHIEDFLTFRLKAKMAPKTAIVDLKTLGTAFHRAESYGIILKNPVSAVRLPKDECSERGVFSHEEVQKLLKAAPSLEWQTLILLGYFLGARLSDCVRLSWENIDLDRGVILYQQKKTGKRVIVPMHFHVLEHLTYLSKFGTKGCFCPSLAERVTGGRNGLSGAFRRIVEKAGLDPGITDGMGIRKFSKRTFHSLRHSFNSALANAGVAEEIRMKLTGHSSKAMNDKYTHLEVGPLKNAMDSLPLFTSKKPAKTKTVQNPSPASKPSETRENPPPA